MITARARLVLHPAQPNAVQHGDVYHQAESWTKVSDESDEIYKVTGPNSMATAVQAATSHVLGRVCRRQDTPGWFATVDYLPPSAPRRTDGLGRTQPVDRDDLLRFVIKDAETGMTVRYFDTAQEAADAIAARVNAAGGLR